jgi:hypothetical protein
VFSCASNEAAIKSIGEEVRVIQKQSDIIDVNADEIILRAPQVAPLAKAIKKASAKIDKQSKKIINNADKIKDNEEKSFYEESLPIALGSIGLLILVAGFYIPGTKHTLAGAGIFALSIVTAKWFDAIADIGLCAVLMFGVFQIWVWYEKRRMTKETLINTPEALT